MLLTSIGWLKNYHDHLSSYIGLRPGLPYDSGLCNTQNSYDINFCLAIAFVYKKNSRFCD